MARTDVKALSDEELATQVVTRERELVAARFQLSTQQLENTAVISQLRKEVSRLRTEARTREIASGQPKGSLLARHAAAAAAGGGAEGGKAERGGFLKGFVDRLTPSE